MTRNTCVICDTFQAGNNEQGQNLKCLFLCCFTKCKALTLFQQPDTFIIDVLVHRYKHNLFHY